jgi:hypothetical protein
LNFIARELCKNRLLVFKDKVAFIIKIKEGKVSYDDGIGVSRKMPPQALIFGSHDNLFLGLFDDGHFYEGRECKDDHNCYNDPDDAAYLQDLVSFV